MIHKTLRVVVLLTSHTMTDFAINAVFTILKDNTFLRWQNTYPLYE
jgi:hypothetical protein